MLSYHIQTHSHLLLGGQTDEPQYPGVWSAMQKSQRPEVLVQGYERPVLCVCLGKDFLVARIFFPRACPHDIMTCVCEGLSYATPHAGVKQSMHLRRHHDQRLDAFLADYLAGVEEAGADIIRFQPEVGIQ